MRKFFAVFTEAGASRRLLRPGTVATYTSTEVLDDVTYAHDVEVDGKVVGQHIPINETGDYALQSVGEMPEPKQVRRSGGVFG